MADQDHDTDLTNDMLSFKILQTSTNTAARLGSLTSKLRNTISTPHYVGITSRGVIPHLSPDMMRKHANLKAVYMALEDFVEKAPPQIPPILSQPHTDGESPLRNFVALTEKQLVVLGPRRIPPIACPLANSNTALAVCTSVGFSHVELEAYVDAAVALRPDIVIGLADIPSETVAGKKRGLKRTEKMCYRTENWMGRMLQTLREYADHTTAGGPLCAVFAPISDVDTILQSSYLDMLSDQPPGSISGLALYSPACTSSLPSTLSQLPRLSLHDPATPHQILRDLALGMDLFMASFLSAATDAGIALDFTFPASSPASTTPSPLGFDMWDFAHARNTGPLRDGCECYACTKHHRAYIQHLLNAKEMLAWILLQIHNLHVVDAFFAGIRASIAKGTFEQDVSVFSEAYEAFMPEKTGQGPRIRGYQRASTGPAPKKQNPPAFRMFGIGKAAIAEDERTQDKPGLKPEPEANAVDLEKRGFGEAVES